MSRALIALSGCLFDNAISLWLCGLHNETMGAPMSNPLQPIHDAKVAIESRQKQRQTLQVDFRAFSAAETIADELTLMRAEMTVMRTLLTIIAAPKAGR
jgi:hypothetical protein